VKTFSYKMALILMCLQTVKHIWILLFEDYLLSGEVSLPWHVDLKITLFRYFILYYLLLLCYSALWMKLALTQKNSFDERKWKSQYSIN